MNGEMEANALIILLRGFIVPYEVHPDGAVLRLTVTGTSLESYEASLANQYS